MSLPIYLDNHATTRLDPRVLDAMLPYFTEVYGNPASTSHAFGWAAAEACDRARCQVAELIGARPREIVFTSGATESVNLAIKGAAAAMAGRKDHLVTAATEHKAVLDSVKRLGRAGWRVTCLAVDPTGLVDPAAVSDAITERTAVVSIMAANNEIGTLAPLAEIGAICRKRGVLLHTDATQAAGKVPIDVDRWKVDLLSLSAHKMYGPKGIGALYVRRAATVRITPQIDGGGHERGLRSGTLAVPNIVGLGQACAIGSAEMVRESTRLAGLRDRLHQAIVAGLPGVMLNGHPVHRLPNNLNLSFAALDGEALMMAMKDVAVSSGSACMTASPEPSHVLRAIGLDAERARASIRFGLGRFTTEEEVAYAAEYVIQVAARLGDRSRRCAGAGTS